MFSILQEKEKNKKNDWNNKKKTLKSLFFSGKLEVEYYMGLSELFLS